MNKRNLNTKKYFHHIQSKNYQFITCCRYWVLVLRSVMHAISRPLLAYAKAYILLQKENTYTLNYDKLFSIEEFFASAFIVIALPTSIGDNI